MKNRIGGDISRRKNVYEVQLREGFLRVFTLPLRLLSTNRTADPANTQVQTNVFYRDMTWSFIYKSKRYHTVFY